jgi:hypothetical protein
MGASFAAQAQRSATVLPPKIFRARVVGISAAATTKTLNAQGDSQSLMSALERKVPAAQINAALDPLVTQLNQMEAGLGDGLLNAEFQPGAEIYGQQLIGALEYGVTPRLSIGVIVPTVKMDVRSRFNVQVNSNASQLAERFAGMDPTLEATLQNIAANLPNTQVFADGVFTANGYDTPRDFSYSGLGDIEIGAKYQYLNASKVRGTCLTGVRAPTTSHQADRKNILDRATGDGQWDFAVECANEFDVMSNLTLGGSSRYTYQLPDSRDMAVLQNGQSGLPNLTLPGTVQRVRRDLGDSIDGEAFAQVNIGRDWSFASIYNISYKLADRYSGGNAGYQVAALGNDTESAESRLEMVVGYSTIPAYSAKQAMAPMEIKLSYNTILDGYNTAKTAYTRMDLIAYF